MFQTLSKRATAAGVGQMDPEEALQWFRKAAMAVTTADPRKMIGSAENFELVPRLSTNSIGKLYLWNYSAKGDGTPQLPYWDKYPMDFIVDVNSEKQSFLGLNMHYLPPYARSKLMDALYETINNTKMDKTTKLRTQYGILKSASNLRYFKPCLKRYLVSHIKSPFLYVKPGKWDVAVLLPLARWKGASQTRIWTESLSKVN